MSPGTRRNQHTYFIWLCTQTPRTMRAEDIGPHISQFPRTVKKRFYLFIYLFMHGQGHKSNERPRRAFVERDGRRCQVGHSRQVNSRAFFLLLASFACLLWLRREQKKKKKEAHRAAARHLHLHSSSSSTLAISHICDARQNKTLLPSRQWRPLKLPPALLPLRLRRSSIPAVACRIRSIRGGGK